METCIEIYTTAPRWKQLFSLGEASLHGQKAIRRKREGGDVLETSRCAVYISTWESYSIIVIMNLINYLGAIILLPFPMLENVASPCRDLTPHR